MGNNCAGIKNKSESLAELINSLNPAIIFLQETKLYYKGQISIKNCKVFETNRDLGRGGGLITTVNIKLDPVEIQSENNNPDVLIVQCKLSNYSVSLINGYGPQESESLSEKMEFFNCLEVSIIKSKMRGDFICVQLDANSKIGMENIIDDPNHISPNGEILLRICCILVSILEIFADLKSSNVHKLRNLNQ